MQREYNEPPPAPEQGSGLGNYRTNPRGIFSAVSPVPLPYESYHEDLEEIVKELEEIIHLNFRGQLQPQLHLTGAVVSGIIFLDTGT